MAKSVVLEISDEEHGRLKKYCKEHGLIMKSVVSKLIRQYLKEKATEPA